jgi:hypothetical protein
VGKEVPSGARPPARRGDGNRHDRQARPVRRQNARDPLEPEAPETVATPGLTADQKPAEDKKQIDADPPVQKRWRQVE